MVGVILGILDASIVLPPRIMVPQRIVAVPGRADPPIRTILLLDSDIAGSGLGAFAGIY